jgi:hypothetical protein
MAHADVIARALARRKTKSALEGALDILLDEAIATDHVRSQQLSDVGFSFQILTPADRATAIATIEAAIQISDGVNPSAARGHFFNFQTRRIE